MTSFSPNFSPKFANLQSADFFPVPPYPKEKGSSPKTSQKENEILSDMAKIHPCQTTSSSTGPFAPLTKLSAAVVEGPSNSDHMGVGLTARQVLHGNFLVDLKNGRQAGSKTRPEKTYREYLTL